MKKSALACDLCPHKSGSSTSLKQHKACHGRTMADLWLSCPKCDYGTTCQQKSNFNNHMKLHMEPGLKNGRLACNKCPYRTDESKNMKKHKKCHGKSEEEVLAMWFSCHDCDFKISKSQKSAFDYHLKLHSETKDNKVDKNQSKEEEESSEDEEDELKIWTDEDSEDEEDSDHKWSEVEESGDKNNGGKTDVNENCSSELGGSTVFGSVVVSEVVKEEPGATSHGQG